MKKKQKNKKTKQTRCSQECDAIRSERKGGKNNIIRAEETYILNEDTQPVIRAIGVSHTACKDEFRQNIRSHSWSVF